MNCIFSVSAAWQLSSTTFFTSNAKNNIHVVLKTSNTAQARCKQTKSKKWRMSSSMKRKCSVWQFSFFILHLFSSSTATISYLSMFSLNEHHSTLKNALRRKVNFWLSTAIERMHHNRKMDTIVIEEMLQDVIESLFCCITFLTATQEIFTPFRLLSIRTEVT